MRRRLWPLLLSLPLAGCTCHSTHSTEVGVLTRRAALGVSMIFVLRRGVETEERIG